MSLGWYILHSLKTHISYDETEDEKQYPGRWYGARRGCDPPLLVYYWLGGEIPVFGTSYLKSRDSGEFSHQRGHPLTVFRLQGKVLE
jgi:hypothetical protein